ncbi:hypothetical protein [Spiroplasma turonicum]|uniref:Transmembrane protein n=1 Tax=Spiroplasma turonicum TaxID=216946 RepID=A0A0K1P637_9MOLU|nr:hypothetical protein [Spiroplasma turonicum]AKU79382.1 hypothetical protein STURON_00136 [Spiroplasma turonicum]ALX70404.1 hypothetical protein STURO_v1c01350 [Spiroplasma turonicum]
MKINKNLEFSIKFILLISMILFLIFDFLLQMYDPKINMYGIPIYDRIDIYFAYFTTQSNYIVVGYLFIAILYKQIYNKNLSLGVELAITVYITLTMVVFWIGIFSLQGDDDKTNIPNWISTVVLHLIIPLIMIGYFIISCGNFYISFKKHLKFTYVAITCYPLMYLLFILIRGNYRFKQYSPSFFNDIYSNKDHWIWNYFWTSSNGVIDSNVKYDSQMWYPYWFLNLNSYELKTGDKIWSTNMNHPYWVTVTLFVIAVFCVASLVTGLQFLYLKINNDKYYSWHDVNDNLLTIEEYKKRKLRIKLIRKENIRILKEMILLNNTKMLMFKKHIKKLPSDAKIETLNYYNKLLDAEKYLFYSYRKKVKLDKQNYKKYIKHLLQNVSFKDRLFVKDNLREAERFKKLIKKGIIISRSQYVD